MKLKETVNELYLQDEVTYKAVFDKLYEFDLFENDKIKYLKSLQPIVDQFFRDDEAMSYKQDVKWLEDHRDEWKYQTTSRRQFYEIAAKACIIRYTICIALKNLYNKVELIVGEIE